MAREELDCPKHECNGKMLFKGIVNKDKAHFKSFECMTCGAVVEVRLEKDFYFS
jgi:DNA-directed RNA polymerase subunit RPC12/RpoP